MITTREVLEFRSSRLIVNDGQQRDEDLVQARLDRAIDEFFGGLVLVESTEAEQQQLVAEPQGFFLVRPWQVDRNVLAQSRLSHLLGEAAALQRPILEGPARRDDLGTEDVISAGIELPLIRHFGPQHREAAGVSVVQDFHDLRALIAQAEVAFIDD